MDDADHHREGGWSYSIRTLSPNLDNVDDVNTFQERLTCERRQTESDVDILALVPTPQGGNDFSISTHICFSVAFKCGYSEQINYSSHCPFSLSPLLKYFATVLFSALKEKITQNLSYYLLTPMPMEVHKTFLELHKQLN